MLESNVEGYLKSEISKLGGLCRKWVSPGARGIPDQIVMMPGARIWFVELKAPGKKPRPQQAKRHRELKALGFEVRVLDTIEKVKMFIQKEVK